MNDPYKVLGVRQGASKEEIKKAYLAMVKKYHPDRFQDPAAKEMANEKLKEINQAYEALSSDSGSQGNWQSAASGRTSQTGYSGGSPAFQQVRMHLNNRRVGAAEQILDGMSDRTAEWYYLRGVCYSMRGWYAMAREHLSKAVDMEPGNAEYRAALNQFNGGTQYYRQSAPPYRTGGVGGMSTCDMCTCALCSDCCCESLGGDLIPCC